MHRKDLICEMKTILTKEISETKQQYDQELDEMKGKIHVLEVENESLRHKVDKLWGEREAMIDNVNSAKTQAVNNAQYARRTNIIIYGVKETNDDDEDLCHVVRELIKEKLKIQLKSNDIEVGHQLGQRTLNKNRPIVIRFRFRDTKWDIMKNRKTLKGTGIIFSEDLCPEMRELQKSVKEHPKIQDNWAWNGKLFAKDINWTIHTIQYGQNWPEMLEKNT